MPLDYDPKDASDTLPEGEYDLEITKVEDTQSKTSGAQMQVVYFRAYGNDGRSVMVKEYIVVPKTLFKLKQIAAALGMRQEFDAKQFQVDDQIGKTLRAELRVDSQEGYDDKNTVKKYLAREVPKSADELPGYDSLPPLSQTKRPAASKPRLPLEPAAAGGGEGFKDDDIPF